MRKIQRYMIEAITAAFLLLFLFWSIGYFANALFGMHFEIKSCWDGFTTLGGAGVLAMVKYIVDSGLNSVKEGMPYDTTGTVKPNQTRDARSVGVLDGVPETGVCERVRGSDESDTTRV